MTPTDLSALDVLRPREVARLYRVADATIYDAIRDGELIAARFGKTFRVLRTDADAWYRGRCGLSAHGEK